MTTINLCPVDAKNAGDAREWALCNYFGCERSKHDSLPYDKASDLSVGDMNISIKASGFSLMSGALCEGRETFDEIWSLFIERVHSNRFAYVTSNWTAYMMNLNEFDSFVHEFGYIERESSKNGGAVKIRCKKESKKMLAWLEGAIAV